MEHADELAKLQRVKHIMTPVDELEWLDSAQPCSSARTRFEEPGYSYAPFEREGRVGLVRIVDLPDDDGPVSEAKPQFQPKELHAEDQLIHAPKWFNVQDAYLVRQNQELAGLVHYSDLNRLAFCACLYHILMALEQALIAHVERVRPAFDHWHPPLPKQRVERARNLWKKKKTQDAELTPTRELSLRDLLQVAAPELAERFELATALPYDCTHKHLKDLRDSVAHVGKPLVADRSALPWLRECTDAIHALRSALKDVDGAHKGEGPEAG